MPRDRSEDAVRLRRFKATEITLARRSSRTESAHWPLYNQLTETAATRRRAPHPDWPLCRHGKDGRRSTEADGVFASDTKASSDPLSGSSLSVAAPTFEMRPITVRNAR